MIYLISKIFWLIAQPLSFAFFLILLGIVSGAAGLRRLQVGFSSLSAIVLFITLFTSTGSFFLQRLEERIPRPQALPADLSCMIVLGGAFETEVTTARGGVEFNQAADRFIEALRLAKAYPAARILVSGGDGSFSGDYEGDAQASARFFTTFDIAPERLIREEDSRTTFENATNTADILARNGLRNCALITSAFHMPRSIGLFRKLGIDVVPWPTDYRTSGRVALAPDFTQPTLNAQQTATALREWIGLLAYYMAGRTHTLFPDA